MDFLSNRVKSLAVSQTLAMSQKSSELRAQGIDVINLSVGEPDFNTPAHIKEAARRAIDENFSFYSPVPGFMSLREAIAAKLSRENGLNFSPAQIVVGNGAKQALCNVILATVNPGDEVVIPTPAWVSYVEMVKLAEGKSVLVPAGIDTNFKITPAQLEAAITERTRMVLLCSPSNPTGSVYSKEELQGLVDVIARHPGILVLADEIYEHINYTGSFTSLGSFPEIADRTIIINGVSKAYAMTGWRLGYALGNHEIIEQMVKIHQFAVMCAPTISQYAAIEAMEQGDGDIEAMRESYDQRRKFLYHELQRLGLPCFEPQGAFYMFPNIREFGLSSGEFALKLLKEEKVAVVPGDSFGECGEGFVRISYAASLQNLKEAVNRIFRFLSRYRT